MSLIEDVRASFKAKGLNFVSLSESTADSRKSILTYTDSAGKTFTKEIGIRLEDLEDTVAALDIVDSEELADFLLK